MKDGKEDDHESTLCNSGVTLGQASIAMTLDRYSYWMPSMGRHAAEGMDKALG